MITKTEIINMWSRIIPHQGQTIGRRVDLNHHLDFFLTYDEHNKMQFMLITEYKPKLPSSSQQISVRGNTRSDGQTAICFSLEDNNLIDQFVSVCWDLMDCSYSIQNKKSAVETVINRFLMWQKLFAEARSKNMSETETKGLIGELTVLRDICAKRYGIDKAILGWVGPLGADRDFEYDDLWLEAKFVSLSMNKVNISSFDQLDSDQFGNIIICRYEKTSETSRAFTTLEMLITEITELIAENENILVAFTNRLALYGYISGTEQAKQPYVLHKIEKYNVSGDEFPRIRRSKIDVAIADGEYSLLIPALQKWSIQ